MLEMRQFCECCGKNLAPASNEALICSFECTFCAACAENVLRRVCPNCGGDLVKRPARSAALLEKTRRRPSGASGKTAAARRHKAARD